MTSSYFLFCGEVSPERLQWIKGCFPEKSGPAKITDINNGCNLYLTGDALMSLVDARLENDWDSLFSDSMVSVIADGDELRLHGLRDEVCTRYPEVNVTGDRSSADEITFWQSLVNHIQENWTGTDKAAFLLCYSPYMSRTPVYMLRFLKSAVEAGLTPELYSLPGWRPCRPYVPEAVGIREYRGRVLLPFQRSPVDRVKNHGLVHVRVVQQPVGIT